MPRRARRRGAGLVAALMLVAGVAAAQDTRTRLAATCAVLSAGCQTCGKPPAERTARAASAPTPGIDVQKPVDEWGRPVRVSINNHQLILESAGADGVHGSPDDVVERCPMQ